MGNKEVNVMSMLVIIIFLFIGSPYSSNVHAEPLDNIMKQTYSVTAPIDSVMDTKLVTQEVTNIMTQQLVEKGVTDYHLEGVEIPNDLPDSGLGKVDLVFYQGIVEIPIVKTLTIDIVNISYKEEKHQYELSEVQKNPSVIIEDVNMSGYSKDSFVFRWVDEQGEDIKKEDLMTEFFNQDDWYLLTEKIEDEAVFFIEAVTHEQLVRYLLEVDKIEIPEKQMYQVSSMASNSIDAEYQLPIILRNDLQITKNKEEIEALINQSLQPKFNKVGSKEEVYTNYTMGDVSEVLNQETLSGTVIPVTYIVDIDGESVNMPPVKVTVLPEGSIDNLDDWEIIPYNKADAENRWLLENPINYSKAGFPHRGLNLDWEIGDSEKRKPYGFHIIDTTGGLQSWGQSYGYKDQVASFVPIEKNKEIYQTKSTSVIDLTVNGWGRHTNRKMNVTSSFFLRDKRGQEGRPSKLKQIFVEKNESFVFVVDLTLKRNLNYEMMMSTYNVSENTRTIGMLEMLDVTYYQSYIPMYVYGNNEGFYMEPSSGKRITMVLKNKKGEWLSDYRKTALGALILNPNKSIYPYADGELEVRNAFYNNFSGTGIEKFTDLKDGTIIIKGYDSGYQFGAPYKRLENDDSLIVGYEMFLGDEIPNSTLTLSNDSWSGYVEERPDEMKVPYVLTDIPKGSTESVFYSSDSKGNDIEIGRYTVPNGNTEVEGTLTLDLTELMDNDDLSDGSITVASIPVTAITETNGIPETIASDEEIVIVTSYVFGAQVKGKTVNKDSNWTIEPEDLLVNKAVLPGNEATYEYVENPPINTKELGLHWVKVKMTDKTENKTKTYEVPVSVMDGTLPSRGIHLVAKDVVTENKEIGHLTDKELDRFLLRTSQATAWNNKTGSLDNITKKIKTKTVHPYSEPGEYEATIVADNGTEETEKTIKVSVLTGVDIKINEEKIPSTLLGADRRSLEPGVKDWVTITKGSEEIDNYTVTLEEVDTQHISEGKKPNGTLKVTVDKQEKIVPVSIPIVWGDSVAIGGNNTSLLNKESALALSLHDDNTGKYLSMSYGHLPDNQKNTPFDTQIGNNPFMQLTHYSTDSWQIGEGKALEVMDGPNKMKDVTFTVSGNDIPTQSVIDRFGTKGRLDVKEGDILRLYTEDAYDKVLYSDNEGPLKPIQGLPNDETTFGVVTKKGFYPTYLAHLKTTNGTIPVEKTTSQFEYDTYLEENWQRMVALPEGVSNTVYEGVKPGGYKVYPKLNLTVGEESEGKVYAIEETTVNQQYIKYAYVVPFVGSGPDLALGEIPNSINFGNPKILSRTQTLSQMKDEQGTWGFDVQDNRSESERGPWHIQMKAEPFKTGVQANYQPLKGSALVIKRGGTEYELNTEFQSVYQQDVPNQGKNEVQWKGRDGFYLTVPPGYIEKEADYTSSVDILLSNVPNTSEP